MKQILPKQIWFNGQTYNASVLLTYSSWNNNLNQCVFYFALFTGTTEQTEIKLTDGNLTMDEPVYSEYMSSSDSIQFGLDWVCSTLGVTLV